MSVKAESSVKHSDHFQFVDIPLGTSQPPFNENGEDIDFEWVSLASVETFARINGQLYRVMEPSLLGNLLTIKCRLVAEESSL